MISLLGGKQADLIERIIQERIGDDMTSWEERLLRCGDAYAFQGDERDVIFLSMVKAPQGDGKRIRKLAGAAHKQRFNVAASRARDQMWLFHSVGLHDLNGECIRSELLDHFVNRRESEAASMPEDVSRDSVAPPFQTLVAQNLYLDLTELDYQIEPGLEVYGQRLDLVVVGEEARVVIDCGERFLGRADPESVVSMHQELERVGWEFIHISAQDYYLNHDTTLSRIRERLDDAGVLPITAKAAARAEPSGPDIHDSDQPQRVMGQVAIEPTSVPSVFGDASLVEVGDGSATVEVPEVNDGDGLVVGTEIEDDDRLAIETEVDGEQEDPWSSEQVAKDDPPVEPPNLIGLDVAADSADIHDDRRRQHDQPEELIGAIEPRPSGLAEYEEWRRRDLRPATQLGQMSLARDLVEIINIEGPITVGRLFRTANAAAGHRKLGNKLRSSMRNALKYGDEHGWLMVATVDGKDRDIVRAPHHPRVKLRKPGSRKMRDYPIDELQALVQHLADTQRLQGEALHRAVIKVFRVRRLKEPTRQLIEEARAYDPYAES